MRRILRHALKLLAPASMTVGAIAAAVAVEVVLSNPNHDIQIPGISLLLLPVGVLLALTWQLYWIEIDD